ncbi:MAG: hypothetical protein RLY78_4234 [Pseudomonadota bacterium]|jgi:hypothetical protein|uniref:Flagellar motor protein MotA n=1 Tax=Pseudaquabacterium rugosum TaxID=2984194 RepID=A0ABU9BGP6_9BURK
MSYPVSDLQASWATAAIATGVVVLGVILAAWLELWVGRRIAAWRSAARLSRTRSALAHRPVSTPARTVSRQGTADAGQTDSALMGLLNATGR